MGLRTFFSSGSAAPPEFSTRFGYSPGDHYPVLLKAFIAAMGLVVLGIAYAAVSLTSVSHWPLGLLFGIVAAQMFFLMRPLASAPYAFDVADGTVAWHGIFGTRQHPAATIQRFVTVNRNTKFEYVRVELNEGSRSIRVLADRPMMLLMHYLAAAHPHIEVDASIVLPKRLPEGFYAEDATPLA